MRIKPAEIILSVLMIVSSSLGILTGKSCFKGFPVYGWVEYIFLAGGIILPILAWFLRSPTRVQRKDK